MRKRAMQAAQACAAALRSDFGATRVVAFGSLVEEDGGRFGVRSDIDLAAWGIPDDAYFAAVARMQTIARGFEVDLVAMQRCPAHLQAPIAEHGEAL
jgi:predicted nucleotidyltransferase